MPRGVRRRRCCRGYVQLRDVGRFTLSPAGGVGRGMWEGSWQATGRAACRTELTDLADDIDDRAELDDSVAEVAAPRTAAGRADARVRRTSGRTSASIWTQPADPTSARMARVAADREYLDVGLRTSQRDRAGASMVRTARAWRVRAVGRRNSDSIQRHQPAAAGGHPCLLADSSASCDAVALVGARLPSSAVAGGRVPAGAPIVYVTAVHLPLLTEARQSLPAQPVLLVLATIGAAHCWAGRPVRHLPSNRRFMNASISDSHAWLLNPPSAM